MATQTSAVDVKVPDIGDFHNVPVIEIHVAVGDVINEEDPLITLESDKATMDVPSPVTGTVREVRVHLDDPIGKEAVRGAVHLHRRLGARGRAQAEDLPAALVHPVLDVLDAVAVLDALAVHAR